MHPARHLSIILVLCCSIRGSAASKKRKPQPIGDRPVFPLNISYSTECPLRPPARRAIVRAVNPSSAPLK